MLHLLSFMERGAASSQAPLTGRRRHARQPSLALPRAPLQVSRWHALTRRESPAPTYLCGRLNSRCEMEKHVYDKRSFRRLPREQCAVSLLFGPMVGECRGLVHRHHVDPDDPDSRTIETCARHHTRLHAALRALTDSETGWKRCSHRHTTPEGRAACERRLNRDLTRAA